MASAQVVETSVTNNSPSQDSYHPDDLFQSRNVNIIVSCKFILSFLIALRNPYIYSLFFSQFEPDFK